MNDTGTRNKITEEAKIARWNAAKVNTTAYAVALTVFGHEAVRLQPTLVLEVYKRFQHQEDDADEEDLTANLKTAMKEARGCPAVNGAPTPQFVLEYHDQIFLAISTPLVHEIIDGLSEDEDFLNAVAKAVVKEVDAAS